MEEGRRGATMIDQMPDDFEILQGKGFVMLSAPHGVEHTRVRVGQNLPEVQTSDLARDLHRSLHCPVIIKTKSNDDDPRRTTTSILPIVTLWLTT